MFGKVLLLLLVAVAVQSTGPDDEDDASITITITKTGDIELQKLRQLIIKASMEAWRKVHKEPNDKLRADILQYELKFMKDTRGLLEQIMKLSEEAKKQKVDIQTCMKEEAQLKSFPIELRKKISACDKEFLAKTRAASKGETMAVIEAFNGVKKLAVELKACGNGADSQKCKTKVDAEISQADRDIPAKIEKAVDDIVPVIQKLMPTVEKCLTDEVTALTAKDQKVAQEIVACINSKIHPKP